MTIKITAFGEGQDGVLYFTRGEGCGGHGELHGEHGAGPEQYFLKGQAGNFEGRWYGAGTAYLGLEEGATVREEDAVAVFGKLADPELLAQARAEAEGLASEQVEALYAEAAAAARLGGKPYAYKPLAERVAARLKRERVNVELDPERVRAIELEEAGRKQPKARNFYDVTFSPSKSNSAYYAGLIAAGRADEAEQMRQLHQEAAREALDYLQQQAGYARAGHHGAAPDGRPSVGRWVDAQDWVMSLWDHQTNREGEPQLHTHALVLNRVRTQDAGGAVKWRALDGASLFAAQRAAAAIYERGFEQRMEVAFPVAYAMRPDGKARELVGISEEERAALSSRAAQISELTEKWAAEYEERTGRPPTAYARTLMQQDAAQQTRKAKEVIGDQAELLRRWESIVGRRLKTTLASIVDRAEAAAIEARARGDAERWERHVVIGQAIDRVQARYATWTRADLVFALNEILPDRLGPSVLAQRGYTTALLDELADEALSGMYGLVMVQGMDLIPVPAELRRADGSSVYQPAGRERYATLAHLDAEQQVVTRATTMRGAEALSQQAIADVIEKAAHDGRTLSEDQVNVVAGVLGDARPIDVVVGPAGAGKSLAQGVIAAAWEATGRRVIGLGPSSKAAQVLQAEGIRLAMNTTRFLNRVDGKGPRHEVKACRLRPGDLVILDEAGMASTEDIVRIAQMAAAAGAKLVLCGDDAQLAAVEAGGLFRELTRHGVALDLGTVRRFRSADGTVREWEARASLDLREGRVRALDAYRTRGRIQSGTADEMAAEIRRSYVVDRLRGIYSAVMTATEDQAVELSGAIRAELAALGQVEKDGTELADGNIAGVGDVIQARHNVNKLIDSRGMPVFNRFNYRVAARGDDGSLLADRITGRDEQGRETLGGRVRLPADYVARHVTLGYAGTVHSLQGATVGTGYALVTAAMDREALYVAMTRGALENHAFVVLEQDEQALEVLAGVLASTGAQRSASETLRTELEWAESIGAHAPVWEDLVAEHQRSKHREILAAELGEDLLERLEAEDASTVYRQVWAAELAGHDPRALVAEAVGERGLEDADSVPALLYWRLEKQASQRTPEHQAAGARWRERTPADMDGALGEHARELAAVLDTRAVDLGERAAEAPPAWAVERLGPVPEDPEARAEWQQRAALVESYREQYQVDAPATVIGPPPAQSMVIQHAAWQAAYQAMGRTDAERDLAEAHTGTLRERVEIWQREQEWAPPSVAEELARVTEERRAHEQAEALARAQAELAADQAERVRLQERAEAEAQQVIRLAGYGAAIEEQHAERAAWYDRTTELREHAEAALAELIRRRADMPEAERQAETERRADAQREREHQADREPYSREQETFRRLREHWQRGPEAAVERERQEQPEAERDETVFAALIKQWDAREAAELERQAAAVETEREQAADELRPRVSERVMEELREAQARTVPAEQATARERTERAEPGREVEAEPTLRERIEAQLAERQAEQERHQAQQAAERAAEPERTMEEINRDHHYEQVAEAERAAVIEAQQAAPVIER